VSDANKVRVTGAVLVAVALLFVKISILNVLGAAEHGTDEVIFSRKAIAVIPMFLVLGIFLLVGGQRGIEWGKRAGLERGPDGRISPRVWAIAMALIGVGLGLWYWVEQRLSSLGYQ
jgi:hypothetical protein